MTLEFRGADWVIRVTAHEHVDPEDALMEEVGEFIARQVLEKDNTFFQG